MREDEAIHKVHQHTVKETEEARPRKCHPGSGIKEAGNQQFNIAFHETDQHGY